MDRALTRLTLPALAMGLLVASLGAQTGGSPGTGDIVVGTGGGSGTGGGTAGTGTGTGGIGENPAADRQVIIAEIAKLGDLDDELEAASQARDAARAEESRIQEAVNALNLSRERGIARAETIRNVEIPRAVTERDRQAARAQGYLNDKANAERWKVRAESEWEAARNALASAQRAYDECRAKQSSTGGGTGGGTGGTGGGTGGSTGGTGGTGGGTGGTGGGTGGTGGGTGSGTGGGVSGTGNGCDGVSTQLSRARTAESDAEREWNRAHDGIVAAANGFTRADAAARRAENHRLELEGELNRVIRAIQTDERNLGEAVPALERARAARVQKEAEYDRASQTRRERGQVIEQYRTHYVGLIDRAFSGVRGFNEVFVAVHSAWFLKRAPADKPLVEKLRVTVHGREGWYTLDRLEELVREDMASVVQPYYERHAAADRDLNGKRETLAQYERDAEDIRGRLSDVARRQRQADAQLAEAKRQQSEAGRLPRWMRVTSASRAKKEAANQAEEAAKTLIAQLEEEQKGIRGEQTRKASQITRQQNAVRDAEGALETAARNKAEAEAYEAAAKNLDEAAFLRVLGQVRVMFRQGTGSGSSGTGGG